VGLRTLRLGACLAGRTPTHFQYYLREDSSRITANTDTENPQRRQIWNLLHHVTIALSVALPQDPAPEWLRRSFRAFAERLRDYPLSRSSNESDR
jgi:hypothetical protein